jgi:hypothetical protein
MVALAVMGRPISKIAIGAALAGLLFGMAAPAMAQDTDSNPRPRPRITVHPRTSHLAPSAKRYCRSWLVQEYRVSGPVIVPRMQCWWQ